MRSGDDAAALRLINTGANVSAKDETGWTPLRLASTDGRVDVAKVLLAHGANIKAKDDKGQRPLH